MQITDKQIRDSLNHGMGNRRARIKRDGSVHIYGSEIDTDRSQDYWRYFGDRRDVAILIGQNKEQS